MLKVPPSWGISQHSVPFGIETLQRRQWLSLSTSLFLGVPRVLPIKDGVLPLGLPFFIFALRLSHAPDERLQDVIECIENDLEILS